MAFTHVLFDLDHTLLDTDTSLAMAFDDAMNAIGSDPAGQYETFNTINRKLWRQVEAGTLSPQQVHLERFVQLSDNLSLGANPQTMADAFAHGMASNGELYPGARELLDELDETTTLALITNGLSDIQRARVDRLDLAKYFDAIVISAEVGLAKPAAEIFDLAFDQLNNPDPSGSIMVGDNLGSDIAGGINAQIATCWYNPSESENPGTHVATFEIASLSELVPIVTGE